VAFSNSIGGALCSDHITLCVNVITEPAYLMGARLGVTLI
jgi:hypothetical protein